MTGIASYTLAGYLVCNLISKEVLLQLYQVYHIWYYFILSETLATFYLKPHYLKQVFI